MTKDEQAEQVANRVRDAAKAARLSHEKVAAIAGVTYPTLRRRLTQKPEHFTVVELIRIGHATGTDWVYLASGERRGA